MKEKIMNTFQTIKERMEEKTEGLYGPADLASMEDGMGTVEVILIIVGICIADKSRILCGNFRCI